jgi:regulator of replication initiation timing
VGSLHRRTGALEEYIESQVEERMRLEIEAMMDVLEEKLTREEFLRVARIVADSGEGKANNPANT